MHISLLILWAFLQLGSASLLTVNDILVAPADCTRRIGDISDLMRDGKWISIAGVLRSCNDDITKETLKRIGELIISNCLSGDASMFSAWRMLVQRSELTKETWADIIKEVPSYTNNTTQQDTLAKFLFTGIIAGNEGTQIPLVISEGKVDVSLKFVMDVVADLVNGDPLDRLRDIYRPLQTGDYPDHLSALPQLLQIRGLRKVLFNVIHDENLFVDTVMSFYKVRMASLFRGIASEELLRNLDRAEAISLFIPHKWDNVDEISRLILYIAEKRDDVNKMTDDLTFFTQWYKDGMCKAYSSEHVRISLTMLENLKPGRAANFKAIRELMTQACIETGSLKSIARTSYVAIPGIENLEMLRSSEFIDKESLLVDGVLDSTKVDASTITGLDTPSKFAKVYRVLAKLLSKKRSLKDPVKYQMILAQMANKKLIFNSSVRSGAFRKLAFAISENDCDAYFMKFCKLNNGSHCRQLIERSLHDVLLSTENNRINQWIAQMKKVAECIKHNITCSHESIANCNQDVVRPNISEVFRGVNDLKEKERPLAMASLDLWIPDDFFKKSSDPLMHSSYLEFMFRAGNAGRFKMVLEAAPKTLVKTPGFMYAMWQVVHFLQGLSGDNLELSYEIYKLKKVPKNAPTMTDICKQGRCTVEVSDSRDGLEMLSLMSADHANDVTVENYRRKPAGVNFETRVEINSTPPDIPDDDSLISDRFMYFIITKFLEFPKSQSKNVFFKHIISYARVLLIQFGYTDIEILHRNLFYCARIMSLDLKAQRQDLLRQINSRIHA
ncbi:hypothetical protein PSACC_01666 [Paramicrosporidium saccamoebae]|uniref:Uncharacterized protein n=1 Tax=Paramicrosporidium saccamoebae TaxID=1246581 RepID=A0A2H9TLD5_9FUNG|nr:hypothetical protein PSACC_01666 [Paramicrosporidium saccamoebae]